MLSQMDQNLSDLIADDAAGALDPARHILVETLAAMKPEIAQELSGLEAAGACLLLPVNAQPLPQGGFDRLIASIDQAQPDTFSSDAIDGLTLPAPLRPKVEQALKVTQWQQFLPGVEGLDLSSAFPGCPSQVQLLRVTANQRIPRHAHSGEELTLVLSGGFTDETGHFLSGDVAFTGPALTHGPLADPGAPCVTLVVSDSAPIFTGAFGALFKVWGWFKGQT